MGVFLDSVEKYIVEQRNNSGDWREIKEFDELAPAVTKYKRLVYEYKDVRFRLRKETVMTEFLSEILIERPS